MLNAFSGTVCEAYGMTECTMGATANPPDRKDIRQGSVGVPVYDTECKVVDLVTGEEPVAFVQLMAGAKTDVEQLMGFTNSQVAAYKKIREIRFLDTIPVSGAGKVLKRELRELL